MFHLLKARVGVLHAVNDARLAKVAGFTFDQIESALCEALEELYPTPDGAGAPDWDDRPWIRDVFDDRVVFSYEGQLFAVPYTFADGAATLGGTPAPVRVEYVPLDGAPPMPPADPNATAPAADPNAPAAAGKAADASDSFQQKIANANAARESLKKGLKPELLWPADMAGTRSARQVTK